MSVEAFFSFQVLLIDCFYASTWVTRAGPVILIIFISMFPKIFCTFCI